MTRTEKDAMNFRNKMIVFVSKHCKMRSHWCNGNPIPEDGRQYPLSTHIGKREPCELYDLKRGCVHLLHPTR